MRTKVFIYCLLLWLYLLSFAAAAQNTARENDSIFEVYGKIIVNKMNSDPLSAIPEAEAFVTFRILIFLNIAKRLLTNHVRFWRLCMGEPVSLKRRWTYIKLV